VQEREGERRLARRLRRRVGGDRERGSERRCAQHTASGTPGSRRRQGASSERAQQPQLPRCRPDARLQLSKPQPQVREPAELDGTAAAAGRTPGACPLQHRGGLQRPAALSRPLRHRLLLTLSQGTLRAAFVRLLGPSWTPAALHERSSAPPPFP
jgi:hypothetical protein